MELVSQSAKGRVYRTDSGQEAVGFAAMYNGSYEWVLDWEFDESKQNKPDIALGYWEVTI